jgi:3-hydroxybutyryl-CoA dehydrogenase
MDPDVIPSKMHMRTAVIGAGTMGHGIAQAFAQSGCEVWLVDLRADILQHALAQIRANLSLFEEQGMGSPGDSKRILSRIKVTTDPKEALENSEFVTEAVSENVVVKKQVFKVLDNLTLANAVLASNTSGLSISNIATATKRPERVIGTNWWNPAHIIPLVEIMLGEKTSRETLDQTKAVLASIGKKPITILKPIQGFIGNRLQMALFREALNLLERGVASVEDIDTAVSFGPGFRYPVLGPFKVSDHGGLDVFYHLSEELFEDLDSSNKPMSALKRLIENNQLGIKSGSGFYNYKGLKEADLLKDRDRKLLRIHRAILEAE